MGASDFLDTIDAVMLAQDMSLAETMFDFENVPSSVVEDTYNYMAEIDLDEDLSGGMVQEWLTVELNMAFKVVRGNMSNTKEKTEVTDGETIRNAMHAAFCDEVIEMGYRISSGVAGSSVKIAQIQIRIRFERSIT